MSHGTWELPRTAGLHNESVPAGSCPPKESSGVLASVVRKQPFSLAGRSEGSHGGAFEHLIGWGFTQTLEPFEITSKQSCNGFSNWRSPHLTDGASNKSSGRICNKTTLLCIVRYV